MTSQIDAGYVSSTAPKRTKAEGQVVIEQMIRLSKELLGGSGFVSKTLASDTFTIDDACILYTIDTEGAAATDDLARIGVTGGSTIREGHVIGIKIANLAQLPTFKHNAGGAKQLVMRNGADYTPSSLSEIVWFQYRTTGDSFHQILPDVTQLLGRMLGAKAATSLTIASNQITPASWLVLLNSGANADLNQALTSNFPDDGPLLILGWSSAAVFSRTIKNNTGGSVAGKFFNNGGIDLVLDSASKFVVYYRTTIATLPAWQELCRFGFDGAPTPPLTGNSLKKLRCNVGETALEFVPDTSGGMTLKSKNANFNVGSDVNTRYAIDTTGGAVTVTFNQATSGNFLDEWEIVRAAGTNDIFIVPYSSTPEYVFDDSTLTNIDTYKMQYGLSGGKVCKLLAVTGGLQIK